MTTTQTQSKPQVTYRKTKSGEWVVYGPTSAIRAGHSSLVTKKDGSTKSETIARAGRPFRVDGVEMVYGYIERNTPRTRRSGGSNWADGHTCYACRCHEVGAPFDGCDRCGCDGDC